MSKIEKALRAAKKYAGGGASDFFAHSAFRQEMRPAGMIHSPIPGRTDKIPMNVKGGSYIIPADIVSGIGQGNSTAGAVAFNKLFKMGPYGAATHGIGTPKPNFGKMSNLARPQKIMKAEGGESGDGEEHHVPIIAAGGEFVIDPETVTKIGGGDMTHGHTILDNLVLHLRKRTIKEMQGLKPPKRS